MNEPAIFSEIEKRADQGPGDVAFSGFCGFALGFLLFVCLLEKVIYSLVVVVNRCLFQWITHFC